MLVKHLGELIIFKFILIEFYSQFIYNKYNIIKEKHAFKQGHFLISLRGNYFINE
jgi:hypothetical protein